MSVDKYLELLKALIPEGRLWSPEEQPVFKKVLRAMGTEWSRVEDRFKALLETEFDPSKTDELLSDWETMLGLPDDCTPEGTQTYDDRREQIVQAFTNIGGLNKAFYEGIAETLGFEDVSVDDNYQFLAGKSRAGDPLTNYFDRQFVAGSRAGDRLREVGWRFYFTVTMPATAVTVFRAGSGRAGDPLREFTNPLLECTYKKLKPAHTGVTFKFTE